MGDRRRDGASAPGAADDRAPRAGDWTAPSPGMWVCNCPLGEWLPEPVTPLFADWLLPVFDAGFRAAMLETAGAEEPIPYALVNGWYYATPTPRISAIPRVVRRTRGRVLRFSVTTIVLPAWSPIRADGPLRRLYRDWHDRLLPEYRELAPSSRTG
jgi:rifampicin phosphotransferase